MRNYSTYLLLLKCKRRVKVATLEVPQLHLISTYNKGVGDVDLFNRLSASYIYLFIYTTFIKRSIHKQTCSNALFNK